jgi:hypothetical protein
MSNVLVLNQPQVNVGLVTCTCTIPATVAGGYAAGGQFNCKVQWFVPQALGTGSGAGTGPGPSRTGLGAGAGGGGEGFVSGDQGLGLGGVGQGFGTGNGYQQPPAYVTTDPLNAAVTSALTITVVDTTSSTTLYTSTVPTATQSAGQFNVAFVPSIGDVITVTLSSANASDATLNGVQSTITVSQGAL